MSYAKKSLDQQGLPKGSAGLLTLGSSVNRHVSVERRRAIESFTADLALNGRSVNASSSKTTPQHTIHASWAISDSAANRILPR